MKTIAIASMLAFAPLHNALGVNPIEPPPTNHMAGPIIVGVGCLIAASGFIVWVIERNNKNVVIPSLTLQRSDTGQAPWSNMITLTNVSLHGTNKLEIFREQMDADPHRDSSFYRTVTP